MDRGSGDEFAIMATLFEQCFGMRLLKITRADLCRRDMRCNSKDGHPRSVAVEGAVDEMQVARTTTARAQGKFACQLCLGTCSEGGDLLEPDILPAN